MPVNTPLQLGQAQGRQQYLAVMFCELGKNRVGAIASINRDIGVDEIRQDRATPLIPRAQRNIDRLPFFNALGLWHAAQGRHRILLTVAGGKNRDDVTQSRYFKIDVGIRIGKLGGDANGLTVAGFECASPRHRISFQDQINRFARQDGGANGMCQSVYIQRSHLETAALMRN